MIVNAIRKIARHWGVEVVRSTSPTLLRGHVARLLSVLEINCVLDVGGHFGEYATMLREIGYAGRIVSFEPVAASFEQLQQAMSSDPHWRGHQLALGAEAGSLEINLFSASDLNSLRAPSSYAETWGGTSMRVLGKEHVNVRRLDEVLYPCITDLKDPRIFDVGRVKRPDELLKMPNFRFSDKDRR